MMENIMLRGKNIDDIWEHWYGILAPEGKVTTSRDGIIRGEVINATSILDDPTRNILKSEIRKLPMRYAIGEMLWYMSGSNKLKEIQKYTSGWDRMSDNGVTVNSNYGFCIQKKFGFDQWQFVKEELIQHPTSRRAIIHIKEPSNEESKDVNCTVCLQFFIREGKLYATTYMRSNDIWMGFPYDVFQFTNMQILMSMELGLELGSYTHIAGSLHLYERDVKEKWERNEKT